MNYVKKKNWICMLFIMLLIGLSTPITVYAAEAEVYFGSQWYEPENGSDFRIGVYLNSEEVIGTYEVLLSYDERHISYVSGANAESDGLITLSGDLQKTSVKHMLSFNALSGGESTIKVESVVIHTADGTEVMDVLMLPEAPVRIAVSETALLTGLQINDIPVLNLDSETLIGSVEIPYAEEISVSCGDRISLEPSYETIVLGENEMYLRVTGSDGSSNLYTIKIYMNEQVGIQEEVTEPENEEVATPEENNRQESPETIQNENAQSEMSETTPSASQPLIRDKNQRSIVTAVVILTCALLLFFVFIIRGFRQKKKRIHQEKLEQLQKIMDANSDFQFCSLYDESDEREDKTELNDYE